MITIPIVVLTCLISYAAWNKPNLLNQLSHFPYQEANGGQYYRLLTSGFVHGSWGHLGINMYVLYQFGQIVEYYFDEMFGSPMGTVYFLFFYISAVVAANMGTFFKHRQNPGFRSVGASGVTTALVFIYTLFDPWQMFVFPPIPAIIFAALYVGYSTWASNNSRDNIDHLAHLYGGIYGILFLWVTYPESLDIFYRRFIDGWPL